MPTELRYDAVTGKAEEVEYIPAPPVVPEAVTMRQARLALLAAGHLAAVDSLIAARPSPQREAAQIEWEYAVEVRRDSPLVAAIGAALGLNNAAKDALFIDAAAR